MRTLVPRYSFGLLAIFVVLVLLLSVGNRARRRLIVGFNKRLLNPFMLRIASRRRTYYAALRHVGRRSGRMYVTPVVAKLAPDHTVLIPLPYGADTDWCRNVLAAGGGNMTLQGQEYQLTAPEVIDASVAEPLVPEANAWLWHRLGIKHYLRLKVTVGDATPTAEWAIPMTV
jgi:deazaflavin-dependent oxidoreductase (nitroreductase family)